MHQSSSREDTMNIAQLRFGQNESKSQSMDEFQAQKIQANVDIPQNIFNSPEDKMSINSGQKDSDIDDETFENSGWYIDNIIQNAVKALEQNSVENSTIKRKDQMLHLLTLLTRITQMA